MKSTAVIHFVHCRANCVDGLIFDTETIRRDSNNFRILSPDPWRKHIFRWLIDKICSISVNNTDVEVYSCSAYPFSNSFT